MRSETKREKFKPDEFKPVEVSDIQMAFPASVTEMMPSLKDIPEEFQIGGGDGHTKWNKLFNDCFYSGVKNLDLIPKDGIDPGRAWRHIRCIMGSYEPKHEHKEAACAYLMSLWFEDATWERAKPARDKDKEMGEKQS